MKNIFSRLDAPLILSHIIVIIHILVFYFKYFEVFMIEVYSASPEQTEFFGEKLGAVLKGGEVIAYFGGLGMGKTRFTAGLAGPGGIAGGILPQVTGCASLGFPAQGAGLGLQAIRTRPLVLTAAGCKRQHAYQH